MMSQMRRATIGLLGIYWLALFVGTHLPVPMKGAVHSNDKFLHFMAFTGLAFLLSLGIGGRRPTWRAFATVFAISVVYAGFDEFSQLLVGRHCDFWDWVADCLGTMFGLFSYWIAVTCLRSRGLRPRESKAEVALGSFKQ